MHVWKYLVPIPYGFKSTAGVITVANAVFGSYPPINPAFLAKAFQLDKKVVEDLQERFQLENKEN